MNFKKSLLYYARFEKRETGVVRALVRYKDMRKSFTTPIVINRTQIPYLDSAGVIVKDNPSEEDKQVTKRLKEYSEYVWQVVMPLMESGELAAITSRELAAAVLVAHANGTSNQATKEG